MKALKITLKTVIFVAIFGFIALLLARIMIADYSPAAMKRFTMTADLSEKYSTAIDSLSVKKQSPMAPYDDAKNGNFFASDMYCVPTDGNIQFTLRYNNSSLAKVASFYGIPEPSGEMFELFDFTLLVAYETEDTVNGLYRRYTLDREACFTDNFLMYHYGKLFFRDVNFDGAIWMRVDITLSGMEPTEENTFGSIVVYEAYEIYKDQKVIYPLYDHTLSDEEKRYG